MGALAPICMLPMPKLIIVSYSVHREHEAYSIIFYNTYHYVAPQLPTVVSRKRADGRTIHSYWALVYKSTVILLSMEMSISMMLSYIAI